MKRSTSVWLGLLMFVSMLFGVAGGGVMGGVAGYYAAAMQPQAARVIPAAASQAPLRTQQTSAGASVSQETAVTSVVKNSEPAVVTILNTMQVTSRRGFGGSRTALAEGSGFIFDAQGHIVTNAHVVQGATQLEVVFSDGTKASAQLVGADATRDIAVLQVQGSVPAYLALGDSSALDLGESVIAIGSPLGTYNGSVTVGVVSGLDRSVQGASQSHLIQTDAAINSGNSGGPLLNLNGEVIGINTLVVRQTNNGDIAEGLGFAIPSNTVASVVRSILGQ